MSQFFRLILSSLWFIVAATISGCGQNHEAQTEAGKNQPRHPGYLRIPLSGPIGILDPGLASETNQVEFIEQLFLGLTDFEKNEDTGAYQAVPELATD
ncbi:MAG TPA: hypothetical protein ENG03_05555 [Thioploca sp.]|nr:MAG: hypothetical protein DRR19_11640 [Gammaproteobacteria bacterium]HDN26550.1 hypothetical protein [Thioploca sp.]